MADNVPTQSPTTRMERLANALTHGAGAVLSLAALITLIICACFYGNVWHIVSFTIFGCSLLILYLSSALFHSLSGTSARKVLEVIDHSAIYILIAGSYTPFVLVNLRGTWGWSLFGIVWGCAAVGIFLKCLCFRRFSKLSLAIYVAMGWLSLVAIRQLFTHVPLPSMILLIIGGLAYTIGVIFYVWRRLPFSHALWHLFVLVGSASHFMSVLLTLPIN